MYIQRVFAIVLLLIGLLSLGYGGFTYTKTTHQADVGPMHFSVDEKEHVNLPLPIGAACLVIGALLLLIPRKL